MANKRKMCLTKIGKLKINECMQQNVENETDTTDFVFDFV